MCETIDFTKYTQYLQNNGTIFSCSGEGLTELNLVEIFKDPRFSRVIIVFCYRNYLTELTIPEGIKMVNCWSNRLTELTIPEGIREVYCSSNRLTELTIPEGVRKVNCSDNLLTELIIPEGVKEVCCYGNRLTELILPEGVEWVECSSNRLTELILPEGIQEVYCNHNQLTELTIPEDVQYVECFYNLLTQFTISKGVQAVDCQFNQLTQLIIPKSVISVNCAYNRLTKITISENNEEIQMLNCRDNELDERPAVPDGCVLWCNIKPKPTPVTLISSTSVSEYRCIYCHSDSLEECSEMWGKKVRGVYLHSCCKKIICEPALLQWLKECENNNRGRECMHCKQKITAYSIFK